MKRSAPNCFRAPWTSRVGPKVGVARVLREPQHIGSICVDLGDF
jgi:hypothetical protein